MKNLNKIASALSSAAVALLLLTACEGAELYSFDAPDWISEKADSIANSKQGGGEEQIEGLEEDVYQVGASDFSNGFWSAFTKYYVIPDKQTWYAQFNLTVNPDKVYYKNFALVVATDDDRGGTAYSEFGVLRYDFTNDSVAYNSQWGGFPFKFSDSNVPFSPVDNADEKTQQMNGRVTVTVDRSQDNVFFVKMTNGTVTKTYTQPYAISPGNNIRCFITVDGSYLNFLASNIEPIGGFTSAEDKQPLSLEIAGVPGEVLAGTSMADAMANVTGTVTFEQGVTKNITAADLQFESIPDFESVGQKTLVALYNKTFKGVNCDKPVMAVKTINVVNELSAFTETVVVPTPLTIGAEDNSTGFWGAHTENIKVGAKETKVVNFTNYTSGVENWNNFCIVLCKADNAEYAVVRADNYGWGNGYAACTPTMEGERDWAAWKTAMDGAKVTAYITNNGDGTADIKAVMVGNDNKTYTQQYKGINTIDADDFYFRFTVDGCHLVFDSQIGSTDNATAFWGAHSTNVRVVARQTCTATFTNYTSGVENWNNFCIVLCKADNTEYAVVRADNYGWGNGYAACTPAMEGDRNWPTWKAAMNGAKVTVQVANKGDGTADVKAIMHGSNGVDYTQTYTGINTIDPDDFYFRFTVDHSYLVME
jgi:hypothetical protein